MGEKQYPTLWCDFTNIERIKRYFLVTGSCSSVTYAVGSVFCPGPTK